MTARRETVDDVSMNSPSEAVRQGMGLNDMNMHLVMPSVRSTWSKPTLRVRAPSKCLGAGEELAPAGPGSPAVP
jgi:hypothetical protein